METSTYDYIIVGAGSAGCVLANRLTSNGRNSVLLIEAGEDDRVLSSPKRFLLNSLIHVPIGFAATMFAPTVTWGYASQPEPHAGNRTFQVIRGKVLGGSSSINGMLHVRGLRSDYDGWREAGCAGWGWGDVLPYFRKMETCLVGEDAWQGRDGPIRLSESTSYPVMDRVLDAAAALGLSRAATLNDGSQFGGGKALTAIWQGRRQSASVSYLHPILRRPNLHLLTGAQVTQITFSGRQASGVTYQRGQQQCQALASREVILAAGAIGSPHLLQVSGVGDAALLRELGVAVIANSPGIGAHLQDHYFARAAWRLRQGVASLNARTRAPAILLEAAKYAFARTGLLAGAASQLFIYARSSADVAEPDIQFSIAPASTAASSGRGIRPDTAPGMTFAACQLRPASRGFVRAQTGDARDNPSICFNYLSAAIDQQVHVRALRLARQITARAELAAEIEAEITPGPSVTSDEALLDYVRATGGTVYHPVGTVRMGADDSCPLDASLRVRGVAGLRVIDASIMPTLTSGNTNAPTLMIAEKGADLVLQSAANG